MIRISLLHPSRGRPHKAFYAVQEWLGKADRPSEIEYIMGLDDDDVTYREYMSVCSDIDVVERYGCGNWMMPTNPTDTIAHIFNKLALGISSTTQLIVLVADDFGCPKHWDTLLWNELNEVECYTDPKFIDVWDGIREPKNAFFSMYFATRAFYNKLGYIYYPEYTGGYEDFDITGLIRTSDRVFGTHIEIDATHLLFPHRHYTVGYGKQDDVHKRLHTEERVDEGLKLLKRREGELFGLNGY